MVRMGHMLAELGSAHLSDGAVRHSEGATRHPGLMTRLFGALVSRCFFAVFGPPD